MVILTHPAFPVPIWKILQTRNHLLQHRPIRPDAVLDLESRVASQRILEKGVEVDLLSSVRSGGELLWESLNTFYCRGRFGQAEAASSLAVSPQVPGPIQAEWNGTPGYGWRFAALTGDFNGIHTCGWYARLFGFRGAFHHPQIVLGHAMARLPEIRATGAQQLDVWLKGPVYYDARIRLRTTPGTGASDFAVHTGEDERPAIIGRWTRNPAPSPWGVPVGSRPGSVSS
jgi:hypothetical protein